MLQVCAMLMRIRNDAMRPSFRIIGFAALAAALVTLPAHAVYRYSGDRCDHSIRDYTGPGVCGDRRLPEDRNRGGRDIYLECSSNSDHHVRGPIPMTPGAKEKWDDLESSAENFASQPERRGEYLKQMHDLRVSEPKIEWSAVIPYQTVENWTWTSCEEHQSASHCGTHEDAETCTRQVEDGKDSNGNTKYKTETYTCYVTHANYCKYDQDERESRGCSTEMMDVHAEFAKPGKEWSPPLTASAVKAEEAVALHLRYSPLIPNKYDLLPGEMEDIQLFSNSGQSQTINPTLEVGDAWNHYKHGVKFAHNGASSAACKYNTRYSANFTIYTEGRDNTRVTPNAFKIPETEDGKLDAFEFFTAAGEGGKQINSRPEKIKLIDSSNGVLDAMSRQMRASSVAIETAKEEAGLGKTGTIPDPKQAQSLDLFKNTKMKIFVVEKAYFWGADFLARDSQRFEVYHGGGPILSLDGNNWEIPLAESYSNLYVGTGPGFTKKFFNQISATMKPGTEYIFLVSMYQEGIPFYAQAKDIGGWAKFWKGEDAYYSKPLVLPFRSPKNYDNRSFFEKLADW